MAIQRRRRQGEILWKVWSSEGNAVWKHGRVSLGVSLHFRVCVLFFKETLLYYKIASVLRRISLDPRNVFSEDRETFDSIFILY